MKDLVISDALLHLANILGLVAVAFVGLLIKNAILNNKIEILGKLNEYKEEQGDINTSLKTHMATDIAEHKELFNRMDRVEYRFASGKKA